MISQILNPSSKLIRESVVSNHDSYSEELWRSSTSRAEVNASTALVVTEREDIPACCVQDVLDYIAYKPQRKNTKFKSVTEVKNLLTSADSSGFFRFFGTGTGRYHNLINGAYGPGDPSSYLSAYTSARAVTTKITLYSSDSGAGNELYTIADVYKIGADDYCKSYKSKANSKALSELKCNITSLGDVSFIIRGSWDVPLAPINPFTGFNASHFMVSSISTKNVLINTKPQGVVSNFLIFNGSASALNLVPRTTTRFGVVVDAIPILVAAQSHAVYSSTNEVVEFVGDVVPFIIAMESEYSHSGEDLAVEVTSNNGVVSAVFETVYEVEIGESFQGDILADDNLRYYRGEDEYIPRPMRARTGYANMGNLVSSILSAAATPIYERAKETWKNFNYKEEKGLWGNLKSFLSKFASGDSKRGSARLTLNYDCDNFNLPFLEFPNNETQHYITSTPHPKVEVFKNPESSFKSDPSRRGYASMNPLQENKMRLFKKATNPKTKPTGDVDPYKSKNFFPILDSVGLSPFLSTLKTRFEGGFGNVIKVAFPTGFQYFPATTKNLDNVVVCAIIKTTSRAYSNAAYDNVITVENVRHHFDARFVMTSDMLDKVSRYLAEDGGSYKDKYSGDYYYSFESGQPSIIDHVTDESWLAAWMLTVDDAPDGSFITGSFEYSEYGFLKGMYMSPKVLEVKNKFVKHLIVMTDEKHCYETGVPPYDSTGGYLGVLGGTVCVSKLSLWIVATLDWGVRGISRTTYIENRVFYPYQPGTTVYDNFHKQISILKMGENNLKGGKYENFLSGDWLGLTRLPHPMKSLIGIKFRNVNTFATGTNIASAEDASYMDKVLDSEKLSRYLTYGYKDNEISMFKVAKVADSGVSINWRDIDGKNFIQLDPMDILKSILNMRDQTSLNSLVSNKSVKFPIDNPIAEYINSICNGFPTNLASGAKGLIQVKTILINARRIITGENLLNLISKDMNGLNTVYEDRETELYVTNSIHNTNFFKQAADLAEIVKNYVKQEKVSMFKTGNFGGPNKLINNNYSINAGGFLKATLKTPNVPVVTPELRETTEPEQVKRSGQFGTYKELDI